MTYIERGIYWLLWLFFLGLALSPAIPQGVEALDVIMAMMRMDMGSFNAVTFAVFNLLGVLPAAIAAIVLFDQDRIPPQPFVLGSFFVGAFAILPYLGLRRMVAPLRTSPGKIISTLGSRGAGIVYLLTAIGLVAMAAMLGDFGAYLQEMGQAKFIALMSLDLFIMTGVLHRLVMIDRVRRGKAGYRGGAVLFIALPLFGPLAYLALRKQA